MIWALADFDDRPEGRDIDGDNFCNFAEYRGLMVAKDSSNTRLGHRHQRLDPKCKTVIVHVRENMRDDADNASVCALMPGYIYKMQEREIYGGDTLLKPEIYFTDSIRFRRHRVSRDYRARQLQIEEARYDTVARDVNFNRAGAGLWYYGFAAPLTYPMARTDTIRAVTFWNWSLDAEWTHPRGVRWPPYIYYGMTVAKMVFGTEGNRASIPNHVIRCFVNMECYNDVRDRFYGGNTPLWQQDFQRQCKRTIAHEFGHTVGMHHLSANITPLTIMAVCDTVFTAIPFCRTDSSYAPQSKAQFSVRR